MKSSIKILRSIVCACISLVIVSACYADDAEKQANSLFNIYESICLKYVNNMDVARKKLQPLPALPPEKAAHFLAGQAGTVWPVPDQHGKFVLAIQEKKNFCAVYARRVDAKLVERKFTNMFNKAPAPLTSALLEDKRTTNANNVPTHTRSYAWSVSGAKRKMLFMLTTSTSENAPLQGMLSAATIHE